MNRRYWLALPLAMSLVAGCRDDRMQDITPSHNTETEEVVPDPKAGQIRFSFDASLEPIETSEGRALSFRIKDRATKQGLGANTDLYSREVAPELEMQIGESYPVYLLFLKEKRAEGEAPVTFGVTQTFKVMAEEGSGKPALHYKGNITLPTTTVGGKTIAEYFRTGEKWYVMAMLNYTDAVVDANQERIYLGRNKGEDPTNPLAPQRLMSGSAVSDSVTNTTQNQPLMPLSGIPFASQWHELELSGNGDVVDGKAMTLVFQPQGTLVQYQIHPSVEEAVEMRRVGMISNALDFSGFYNCSPEALYKSFAERNTSTGIGLPKWEADSPSNGGFDLYWMSAGADGASSGARFYPWNMPQLSDSYTPTTEGTGMTRVSLADASVKVVSRAALAKSRGLDQTNFFSDFGDNDWYFMRTRTGTRKTTAEERTTMSGTHPVTIWMWGMPKAKAPAQPYTYFFASSYSSYKGNASNDVYNPGELFDPRKQLDPKSANYKADSAKYYGTLLPAALRHTSPRTQPLMVLYQSNQTFAPRRIYHAQTVMEPDLQISEVVYYLENGENYSAIELYNPGGNYVDLKDYALVRLIPNTSGTHLSYRTKTGGTTDDLSQAQILPLQAIKAPGIDGYTGTGFSAWANQGYSTTEQGRYEHYYSAFHRSDNPRLYGAKAQYNKKGRFGVGIISYSRIIEDPIWPKQTLMLGASGYVNAPTGNQVTRLESDTTVTYAPRRTDFPTEPTLVDGSSRSHRIGDIISKGFVAYADGPLAANTKKYGQGVLDYHPGEAFALLRSNGSGGWQIIDASGPVGPKGIAFAGSYSDYKAKFAGLSTTQKQFVSMARMSGVNFPFIYPYRTKRTTKNWCDDWYVTTGSKNTVHNLGMRARALWASGAWMPSAKKLDEGSLNLNSTTVITRTPLDESYTYYKQHIPAATRDN